MEYLQYTVKVCPAAEGGYWAEVPALPGCFRHGATMEEVTALVRDAIEYYLANLVRRNVCPPIEKATKKSYVFPLSIRLPHFER